MGFEIADGGGFGYKSFTTVINISNRKIFKKNI